MGGEESKGEERRGKDGRGGEGRRKEGRGRDERGGEGKRREEGFSLGLYHTPPCSPLFATPNKKVLCKCKIICHSGDNTIDAY